MQKPIHSRETVHEERSDHRSRRGSEPVLPVALCIRTNLCAPPRRYTGLRMSAVLNLRRRLTRGSNGRGFETHTKVTVVMASGMEGKIALVTGATSGIGYATAELFASRGASVVLSGRNEAAGEEAAAKARQTGGDAIFIRADVADPNDVQRLVEATLEQYGGLDYAFNNAGIEGRLAPVHEQSVEDWERVISTNLNGVFYCMKYQIPPMLDRGGGSIVNCSSIMGQVASPVAPAYVASKHALNGLTKSAALSYATQGIRVNGMGPGYTHTAMLERADEQSPGLLEQLRAIPPVQCLATSHEIATAVVWLCSDEASYVTGHTMIVDGGVVAQ
jgi:NAD(P)-dependent dehydrogenase (short-subunit alcohol dehydrogenase family)